MKLHQLKTEIDRLSLPERKQLTAYLVIRDKMLDPEFHQELADKMDGHPERWITLEEAERRLLP